MLTAKTKIGVKDNQPIIRIRLDKIEEDNTSIAYYSLPKEVNHEEAK